MITIHACQVGKDVFVQKPMAFTVKEGLEMVKAVRSNGRVLQVGSQQRSSKEFQQAIAIVRSGGIGHVETIYAKVGDPPKPLDLPEQPVPPNLNFNQWMGPLNDPAIHYHPDLCPPISLEPEENESCGAHGVGTVKLGMATRLIGSSYVRYRASRDWDGWLRPL